MSDSFLTRADAVRLLDDALAYSDGIVPFVPADHEIRQIALREFHGQSVRHLQLVCGEVFAVLAHEWARLSDAAFTISTLLADPRVQALHNTAGDTLPTALRKTLDAAFARIDALEHKPRTVADPVTPTHVWTDVPQFAQNNRDYPAIAETVKQLRLMFYCTNCHRKASTTYIGDGNVGPFCVDCVAWIDDPIGASLRENEPITAAAVSSRAYRNDDRCSVCGSAAIVGRVQYVDGRATQGRCGAHINTDETGKPISGGGAGGSIDALDAVKAARLAGDQDNPLMN